MDPKNDADSDYIFAPSAGYTLIATAFLVKTATWMVRVLTDGTTSSDGQMGQYTNALMDLTSGPFITTVCVIMIVAGGFIIMFGGGGASSQSDAPTEDVDGRRPPMLKMSEVAQSAEARLNGLIAQFRSIPENMVLPEAIVEFERIESSHVPDLQDAHREARATVPAMSAKSDALDADYAVSLARISDALERLIESCEALGRERLEVQGRFIEARHPTSTL